MNLKHTLKTWNWDVFGDLNSKIKNKLEELQNIQIRLSNSGFPKDLFLSESNIHHDLDVLLRRHECFLLDRSRVKWLQEGDLNDSFFHVYIKYKQCRVPTFDEINDIVFSLDANFTPDPDGFRVNSSSIVGMSLVKMFPW
ncbi:hypothetical protein Ddye_006140 [Dipteronia dyeriana]|uniref:Uncharacterized protein n=1 Tax=Dipteronia dyeriana TaxID=168575 RepID=A0AAE0CQD2_9ROSI|nr:hypothetical protein Ddye_006140 [Dipteronia dyeriana]